MVVVQLVEWSLPTPEVHGSNGVVGKFYLQSTALKAGMGEINRGGLPDLDPDLSKNRGGLPDPDLSKNREAFPRLSKFPRQFEESRGESRRVEAIPTLPDL